MRNNVAISLLLSGSQAVATPSPTKSSITDAVFPMWKVSSNANELNPVDGNGGSVPAMGNWATNKFATNTITGEAVKNSTGQVAGLYGLFRMATPTIVFPTQNLADPLVANDDNTNAATPVKIGVMGAGKRSLYETSSANVGTYQDITNNIANCAAQGNAATNINKLCVKTQRAFNSGERFGACLKAQITDAAGAHLICPTAITQVLKDDSGSVTTIAYSYIYNRLGFIAENALAAATTESDLTALNTAPVGVQASVDITAQLKLPALHTDIILGTFYQSNGNDAGGATWCYNGGDTAAKKLLFKTELSSTNTELSVYDGFGAMAKCTWQVEASDNVNFPVLTMTKSSSKQMQFQVIEWYNTATFAGNTLIDPSKAKDAPSMIAPDANMYTSTNGIFFNPIKDTSQIQLTLPEETAIAWFVDSSNAATEIPDSIGSVLYYDRSTGQSRDTMRSVDSSWVIAGFGGWNTAVEKYNAAVTKYEEDKKAYEADPATKDKPAFQPYTLGSFSGRTFNECITTAAKTDLTKCPTATWTTKMIGTGDLKDSMEAFPVTTLPAVSPQAFTDSGAAATDLRVSYIQISKDMSVTQVYDATADYATKTFGRLGQSKDTGLTGKPFSLEAKVDNAKAGMQISLFPEVYQDASKWVWDNWTLAADTRPTIHVKQLPADVTDLTPASPGASPTAISTVTVGAQALAASIIASASIAATLF